MKKHKKAILISLLSVSVCAGIGVGGFFAMFPMAPKVDVKSADDRISVADQIIVSSYNTAAPWGNLIEGTYTTRRMHLFASQINETMPDSLGVQEINSDWVSGLESLMPQYAYYGVKRGGDDSEKTSEMSGIFYLKDKYDLVESRTFWVTNTPEVESKFEGAACNRIVSYVVLKNKQTGFTYIHINTHLDHVSSDAQALGGKLIAAEVLKLKEKYGEISTVITGDFNQYESDKACQILIQNGFINCNMGDKTPTYHGWGKSSDTEPIDFIFADPSFTVKEYKVHNNKVGRSYASDHYMLTATLSI